MKMSKCGLVTTVIDREMERMLGRMVKDGRTQSPDLNIFERSRPRNVIEEEGRTTMRLAS
jgi:hypothetical protein